MSQIVGLNISEARDVRGWSLRDLSAEVQKRGPSCSANTVGRYERGEVQISVDALVTFGLALGVAPIVLLCPPLGSDIAVRAGVPLRDDYSLLGFVDEEEKWLEVSGAILTHGPWEPEWGPDENASGAGDEGLRKIKVWEKERWRQASLLRRPEDDAAWAAARPQRVERARLVSALIPTLPRAVRQKLTAAGGSWAYSGIEDAWNLEQWSIDRLRERAGKFNIPPAGPSPVRQRTSCGLV